MSLAQGIFTSCQYTWPCSEYQSCIVVYKFLEVRILCGTIMHTSIFCEVGVPLITSTHWKFSFFRSVLCCAYGLGSSQQELLRWYILHGVETMWQATDIPLWTARQVDYCYKICRQYCCICFISCFHLSHIVSLVIL